MCSMYPMYPTIYLYRMYLVYPMCPRYPMYPTLCIICILHFQCMPCPYLLYRIHLVYPMYPIYIMYPILCIVCILYIQCIPSILCTQSSVSYVSVYPMPNYIPYSGSVDQSPCFITFLLEYLPSVELKYIQSIFVFTNHIHTSLLSESIFTSSIRRCPWFLKNRRIMKLIFFLSSIQYIIMG